MERITIVLEPLAGDDRPFPARLRLLLKRLLRTHGMRCVSYSAGRSLIKPGAALRDQVQGSPVNNEGQNHANDSNTMHASD